MNDCDEIALDVNYLWKVCRLFQVNLMIFVFFVWPCPEIAVHNVHLNFWRSDIAFDDCLLSHSPV